MFTLEGKKVDRKSPLSEYPTPQFRRESYLCLNGEWEFEMNDSFDIPGYYSKKILVPFAVETPLSGIEKPVEKTDVLHYRKTFSLPAGFKQGRVLLHFEAVDQVCDVYLNGVKIAHNEGGYFPFTVDCLELRSGENEILVTVTDDTSSPEFPRGKQSRKPKGIWYTATSGIWGSVWLESVPNQVIQSLSIVPDFDKKSVHVSAAFEGKPVSSEVEISMHGKVIAQGKLDETNSCDLSVASFFFPWSPEKPELYDLRVKINDDEVFSYFAMRKYSIVFEDGKPVFGLNNKPYFLSGVLDQGYFPDGGLTPPTDKAMRDDIMSMKHMGFNMLRKHIKIEPMRWYYHCDTVGMIVIQDIVNFGNKYKEYLLNLAPFFKLNINDETQQKTLGSNPEGQKRFREALPRYVQRLFNCPCIAMWTLFNEGWGQFNSVEMTDELRKLDSTRLIDSCSGWFDMGAGDTDSHHIYFKKIRLKNDGKRVLSVSEFGGYCLTIANHCSVRRSYAYKKVYSLEGFAKVMTRLYEKEILPAFQKEKLSITVLTQLCDVEQEVNGLLTYDRKIHKIEPELMRRLNEQLKFGK